MTNHTGRLYALALALVVFFLAWAVVAARPWTRAASSDPRLRALAARERQLRREAKIVSAIVARRFAVYHAAVKARAARQAAVSAATAVRVVTLPPLTVTKTS